MMLCVRLLPINGVDTSFNMFFLFAYAKTKAQILAADQRFCFRYIARTNPLLLKSVITSIFLFSVAVQSGLVENPDDRFCRDAAQMVCIPFEDFYGVFNNLSVISQRCLVVTGSLMLTFIWYQVPNTLLDTAPSHIILTPGRLVLAIPQNSECQAGSNSYHFNDFGMSRPGMESGT